jgi:hypothetical protein
MDERWISPKKKMTFLEMNRFQAGHPASSLNPVWFARQWQLNDADALIIVHELESTELHDRVVVDLPASMYRQSYPVSAVNAFHHSPPRTLLKLTNCYP